MGPSSRLLPPVRAWLVVCLAVGCGGEAGPRVFPPAAELFGEALARFDTDGDGTLGRDEYARFDASPGGFERIDLSRDGTVDRAEFTNFTLARQPRALVGHRGPPGFVP